MVDTQTGSAVRDHAQARRGLSRAAKQRALSAVAVILMASGATMLVASLVLSSRTDAPKLTVSSALASKIEKAGLGCDLFTYRAPIGIGVVAAGQCDTKKGSLTIVVYKTPKALIYAQNLTRSYECLNKAAAGETKIVSIVDEIWEIRPSSSEPAAAEAIRGAVGGHVTTFDCAPPPPAAPPPEPAPEAPPV